MALFGKKNKEESVQPCGRGTCGDAKQAAASGEAAVKVLGSGCQKCNELEANTKAALAQLNMDTTVGHVTDFAQIAAYGVMSTPALVVDGKVVAYGKVLKTEEIVKLLQKVR